MKPFTLLLIDDIPNNIYSLRLIIESNFDNLNILSANSAKEAIALIMQHEVDLILSDVQMPELSGLELAAYLHETEQTKQIPIILISAIYNSAEKVKEAYAVGVVDYIVKPIDDDILCAKLKVFIDIYEKRKHDKIQIVEQEERLEEKAKITSMVNNLSKIPNPRINSLDAYYDLVAHMDNDLIDLSNVNYLKTHPLK